MARFLHRVRLENYKSIAHCDVELQDLTFLVGPNGAGKSNFLEIIRIINNYNQARESVNSYKLQGTFDDAIRQGADHFSLDFTTQSQPEFIVYKNGNFVVRPILAKNMVGRKQPAIISPIPSHYKTPTESKGFQSPLTKDCSNLNNVLFFIQINHPLIFQRIHSYIKTIAPEIERVWVLQAGGYDILQFSCVGSETPFNASQMSDGTLHALGVLTAIFHAKSAGIALLGIEEPEAGLHPAAARVLREALIEASEEVQIIVTSHSPDLLDSPDIHPDSILAVVRENGETKIGPIDAASRKTLDEHLFTAGELLRLNQLEPERVAA